MYKLFTRADDGTIDIADAGLTEEEFSERVTVAQLEVPHSFAHALISALSFSLSLSLYIGVSYALTHQRVH